MEKSDQPAVIADMHNFLHWLVPTIEKFPRSQRFVLGDRIENLALDMLELLIEASYSRRNRNELRTANMKLEKSRMLATFLHVPDALSLIMPTGNLSFGEVLQ